MCLEGFNQPPFYLYPPLPFQIAVVCVRHQLPVSQKMAPPHRDDTAAKTAMKTTLIICLSDLISFGISSPCGRS